VAKEKRYPIPTNPDQDAIGEYETDEQLAVLDDFHASGFLVWYHEALESGDREALDRGNAERSVWVHERFLQGERQTKEGFLSKFGDKKTGVDVKRHTAQDARLICLGEPDSGYIIIYTGQSNSEFVVKADGRVSHGPRLFCNVFMKLGGRWQQVVHTIMDFNGTFLGDPNPAR